MFLLPKTMSEDEYIILTINNWDFYLNDLEVTIKIMVIDELKKLINILMGKE